MPPHCGWIIQKWPSHYRLFKVGRVTTNYSSLAESLRTIQSWPTLIDPLLNTRQYASFTSTSPIIGFVRPCLDDDKTLH
ncbi:hypothetical protein MTR_6g091607 [Medicago truncatula]|uniref:Uncharacterized protein n=1 Tax=Medicago truncatula TaxID=3880 RepID=A0A072UBP7_MEDTR|nr:hypothetical protein MTR_6g091607 [Medicago truncatula]